MVYRVSPLTYRLGKPFVQVDTFAMPNLVAGRRIVPELIQDDFTPERTAEETIALLTDANKRAEMLAALAQVKEQLGSPGATARPIRCSRLRRARCRVERGSSMNTRKVCGGLALVVTAFVLKASVTPWLSCLRSSAKWSPLRRRRSWTRR